MALLVTFIEINDETGDSYGRSWEITDPQVEVALRHLAHTHFGQPVLESTGEEAFSATKQMVENGEGSEEAKAEFIAHRAALK